MKIYFSKHGIEKFEVLIRHEFNISRLKVIETIQNPDLVDESRLPLLIAQKRIDRIHVMRVVYKIEFGIVRVITFYPGRSKQYENKKNRNN